MSGKTEELINLQMELLRLINANSEARDAKISAISNITNECYNMGYTDGCDDLTDRLKRILK